MEWVPYLCRTHPTLIGTTMPLTLPGCCGSRARVQRILLDYTKWYVDAKLLYTFLRFLLARCSFSFRFNGFCVCLCESSLIMRCVWLTVLRLCCWCRPNDGKKSRRVMQFHWLSFLFVSTSKIHLAQKPRTITYITITIRRSALLTSLLKFLLWCIVNAERINF